MASLGVLTRGLEALQRQFPNVDQEALELFGDACSSQPGPEAMAALAEMEREARAAADVGQGGRAFLPTRCCTVRAGAGGEDLEVCFEDGGDPPRVGTVLLMSGLEPFFEPALQGRAEAPVAAVAIPTGEVLCLEAQPGTVCFQTQEYGMHELRLVGLDGRIRRCRFMASSHLGDFAEALDHFHDSCDWVWDGGWTEEFEEATMGLLAALDNHFEALEAMMKRSPMGYNMLGEIGPSKRRLETSLAKALEGHDAQAVGRVYGAVRSLLSSQSLLDMFAPMLGGGTGTGPLQDSALYQTVVAFEKARFSAASEGKRAEVKAVLARLISAADAYVAELRDGQGVDFVGRWRRQLRDTLIEMRDNPNAVIHPLPFQQLRGEGGGYIADMMKGMVESFGGSGAGRVQRAETIEGVSSLSPATPFAEGRAKVTRWAESLVDESISYGSPMTQFEVHGRQPWVRTVMASMNSLLSLGFGYVTQGGGEGAETSKLIALLDRVRATLPLNGEEEFLGERRRRERLKDVCRVVRACKKKGQRLRLSVNTDFRGALDALRQHHSDNWVGPSLQGVWEQMLPDQRVFAFELWLIEEGEGAGSAEGSTATPRLVAADFGHPHTHGLAYYVATRFFDREYRNLQPGFILAFAEAECLKRAGFALWDLGGADRSPMMQYKPQVAIEMDRSDFLRRLRECGRAAATTAGPGATGSPSASLSDPAAAPTPSGGGLPSGTVFADITEEELWGAAALRAKEDATKAEQQVAAAAAKKQQKPAKVARKAEAGRAGPPTMQQGAEADAGRRGLPAKGEEAKVNPPVAKAAGAAIAQAPAPTADSSVEAAKAVARQHFMAVFQRLLREGVPQQDAAARALQVVTSR